MGALAPVIQIASFAYTIFSGFQEASNARAQASAQQAIYNMQAHNEQVVAQRNALIVQDQARTNAEALRTQGGQDQAQSQRAAIEQQRQNAIIASNAIAQSGGTGGDALDPSVLNIMGKIGEAGQYNKNVALYQGDARANAANNQATLTEFEGKQQADMIKYGGDTNASLDRYRGDVANFEGKIQSESIMAKTVGSMFDSGTSFYEKYTPKTYMDGGRDNFGSPINWNY